MGASESILFLCPHNAAKSLLAAADFGRMASARGLPFWAFWAGTDPADKPSPAVVALLRDEGIDIAGYVSRSVTTEDLTVAALVISLGCVINDLPGSSARIERWDDVPPVSQDLAMARDVIRHRREILVDEFAAGQQPPRP